MQITYMIIRRRSSDAFQSSMRRSWDRGREATTTTITELTLLPEMGVIQVAFLAARFRVDAPTSTPTPLLMIRRASPVRIPPPVPLYLVVFFWGGLLWIEMMGRSGFTPPKHKGFWILLRIVRVYPQSSRTGFLFAGIVEVGCVWDIVIVPVSELWNMGSLLQPTHL